MALSPLPEPTMSKPPALRLAAAALAAVFLLAACGGGGGGGDDSGGSGGTGFLGPNLQAEPLRATEPLGPSSQFANICTTDSQKAFVRAYLDEVYLWYDEIPKVDPTAYTSVRDYFDALLVKDKDRFSAVISTGAADQAQGPPPAGTSSVPIARVDTVAGGRRVGYIRFDDHDQGAQDALITAFRQLRDGGAQDLVLDLRLNSGGFLYIAQAAASMLAGPGDAGKVFERLRYNDKRAAASAANTFFFSTTVTVAETRYPRGTALPQLDLPRVYILTSGLTCSASESIINSLRGIDREVVLVGDTTCGKPYGFHRRDNCGLAYFPIEFAGTNDKGFGDYASGFAPTCQVADDASAPAGSATDPLYNAALTHLTTGACPAGSPTAQASALPRLGGSARMAPQRPFTGRLLGSPS